jgi:small conductance mechanosensitive channel
MSRPLVKPIHRRYHKPLTINPVLGGYVMGPRHTHPGAFRTALLIVGLVLSLTTITFSQEKPAGEVSIPTESLDKLIRVLETQQDRDALIRELKALRESQTQPPEKEIPRRVDRNLVQKAIIQYGQLTRQASAFFEQLFDTVRQGPGGLTSAKAHLSAQKNRAAVYRIAAVFGVGIAIALVIVLLVRRFTSAMLKAVLRQRARTTRGKVYEALIRMIIRISPYAALYVAGVSVVGLLGIRGIPYRFAVLFLLTLLIYRGLFNVGRILLSPYESEVRILPLADEDSAYTWIWTRRFLNYWILYFFVTQSLVILRAPQLVYGGISKILLVFFPILSTIFFLQVRRMLTARGEIGPRVTFWRRFSFYFQRVWPLVAAGVIWVVSVFVLAEYRDGIVFLLSGLLKTLAVIGVLWVVLWIVDSLFARLFRLGKETRLRFPGLEEKTNRYIGTARRVIKWVLVVIAIGGILDFWGLKASWFITSELGSSILSRVIAIGIVVVVVMLIIDLSGFLSNQLVQPRKDADGQPIQPGRKKRTLAPLFHWLVDVAAIFVGGVVILRQFGINVTPILAGAGIVGLAVGFGAQSLVKDFINGLFLLFEDSVAVGDVVVVNGTGGLVEGVSLRTVKLRDLAGNVHVIPNGSIDMITNMTKEYSRYVFEVGVAYREDVDEVMGLLKEIGESMENDPEYRDDIIAPLEILGVDKFDDSAVVIKARFTTKPIKQWRVGREFNRRMKKIFDERNIEIPFPHRTLYWGEAKTGQTPPVPVQLSGQTMSKGKTVD